jgi:hypothetical protein
MRFLVLTVKVQSAEIQVSLGASSFEGVLFERRKSCPRDHLRRFREEVLLGSRALGELGAAPLVGELGDVHGARDESLERDFVPPMGSDEALQMPDVFGDDRASDREGLGGEDGVPVEGLAGGGRLAGDTSFRPEPGSPPHGGGIERQVVEGLRQAVETDKAPGRGTSAPEGNVEQAPADLVVHDLGEVEHH